MVEIKKKIKAIIFDMDGTIVSTEPLWRKAEDDTFAHYNISITTPEQRAIIPSFGGMSSLLVGQHLKELFSLTESSEDISRRLDFFAMHHFANGMNFIHGFEAFQKKLALHNIPSGIATNTRREPFSFIINAMKLNDFFGNHLYCVDDVQYKPKPDPSLFLFVAQKLGARPEECLVFEDSIHGFKAAQAAGMKCIAIQNENNKDLLHYVHGAIASYDQAEEILKNL
ncbi:HAD family phosphatase [Candidatus Babeliales bacterium]|nr:HAD family phosphatase [Candidatus Babeliales bacterium]